MFFLVINPLLPFYKNKFKQDVARMEKRGKQLKKLQEVMVLPRYLKNDSWELLKEQLPLIK